MEDCLVQTTIAPPCRGVAPPYVALVRVCGRTNQIHSSLLTYHILQTKRLEEVSEGEVRSAGILFEGGQIEKFGGTGETILEDEEVELAICKAVGGTFVKRACVNIGM